ncbi:hypothetical protein BDF22DRAFT_493607 [Syncephalis plumigaleata]|nr:hypothetical protein BDF22DRAFT_493607 [Syncephalis plumigaleata]
MSNMAIARRKRMQVKCACEPCHRACKKCDDARPCTRCVRYGYEASCVDHTRKARQPGVKRGPYRRTPELGSHNGKDNGRNGNGANNHGSTRHAERSRHNNDQAANSRGSGSSGNTQQVHHRTLNKHYEPRQQQQQQRNRINNKNSRNNSSSSNSSSSSSASMYSINEPINEHQHYRHHYQQYPYQQHHQHHPSSPVYPQHTQLPLMINELETAAVSSSDEDIDLVSSSGASSLSYSPSLHHLLY